jgi:hypothetical protein
MTADKKMTLEEFKQLYIDRLRGDGNLDSLIYECIEEGFTEEELINKILPIVAIYTKVHPLTAVLRRQYMNENNTELAANFPRLFEEVVKEVIHEALEKQRVRGLSD